MAKYILKNRGKGTYGLGEENISPLNLEPLSGNVLPTLDQILENSPTTIYPIEHKEALTDNESATLGQVKELINSLVFNGKTALISGGVVQWAEVGFDYDVSISVISIEGDVYTIPADRITLSPSDVLYDRIDLVYVDETGYHIVTGTPDESPVEPALPDPDTQIKLSIILVNANATEPADVDTDLIYDENIEWVVTSQLTNGTIDSNNTTNPYQGTKSLNVSGLSKNNFWIQFRKDEDFTLEDYDSISFRLHLKAEMHATESLRIRFHNEAGVPISDTRTLNIQKNIVGEYQYISIAISDFEFIAEEARSVRLFWYKGKTTVSYPGFYVDVMRLQSGVVPPVPEDPSELVAGLGLSIDDDGNLQLGVNTSGIQTIDLSSAGRTGIRIATASPQYFELGDNNLILSQTYGELYVSDSLTQLRHTPSNSLLLLSDSVELSNNFGDIQWDENSYQLLHSTLGNMTWNSQFQIVAQDEEEEEYFSLTANPDFYQMSAQNEGTEYFFTIATPTMYQVSHPFFFEMHNETTSLNFHLDPNGSKYGFIFRDDDVVPESFAKFMDNVNLRGIEYEGDYEANFTARSLITRQFLEASLPDLSGDENYLTKYNAVDGITESRIFDNGTKIGIGTIDFTTDSTAPNVIFGRVAQVGLSYGTTYFGDRAGFSDDLSNNFNTGFGTRVLESVNGTSLGYNNAGFGSFSLMGNTSGHNNTALGYYTLGSNTTGFYNVAVGGTVMYLSTTGSYNTGTGYAALQNNSTGQYNTGVGFQAGIQNTTGSYNTYVGARAMEENLTGSNNVFIGYWSGMFGPAGNNAENSIAIGAYAALSTPGVTNELVIGYNTVGWGSNSTTLGNASITKNRMWGTLTHAAAVLPTESVILSQLTDAISGIVIPPAYVPPTPQEEVFTYVSGDPEFILAEEPITTDHITVFINGQKILRTDFTVTGTTLEILIPLEEDYIIEIQYYSA